MSRPIRATLDLDALRHNYAVARRCAPDARHWAVVKANAYGHGLERTVRALEAHADGFALIELDRAVALRQAGLSLPLLLLEGFYAADELPAFIAQRLVPVVHRQDQIQALLGLAWPDDLPVYLKIDSGMHRLGFDAPGLEAAHAALVARGIPVVHMSHYADADGPRGVAWQVERFAAMTVGKSAPCSLGNSATILRHPAHAGDWARPGIMLYGGSPFADTSAATLGLKPVMTLQSEIIAVQHLALGESVGYGCTFTTDRPMRVGVVACGYADGYPRHAGTGTPILVAGLRTRTLGRVSMDKLCVDLTGLPDNLGVGSTATLWGGSADAYLAADEVAAAAGTISYELFCALAARVPVCEVG